MFGTKLPPIRQLSIDLGLARGTVNEVYDALAREGLVETAGRHGTIVVRQLGLDDPATHAALGEALHRLSTSPVRRTWPAS